MDAQGSHQAQADKDSISVVVDGNRNIISVPGKQPIPLQRPPQVEHNNIVDIVVERKIDDQINSQILLRRLN